MRRSTPDSDDFRNSGFRKFVDGFLLHSGLPFASVLTAEKIAAIERSFPNRRSANAAVRSPMTLNNSLTAPGCGKAVTQNLWTASHSPFA